MLGTKIRRSDVRLAAGDNVIFRSGSSAVVHDENDGTNHPLLVEGCWYDPTGVCNIADVSPELNVAVYLRDGVFYLIED